MEKKKKKEFKVMVVKRDRKFKKVPNMFLAHPLSFSETSIMEMLVLLTLFHWFIKLSSSISISLSSF